RRVPRTASHLLRGPQHDLQLPLVLGLLRRHGDVVDRPVPRHHQRQAGPAQEQSQLAPPRCGLHRAVPHAGAPCRPAALRRARGLPPPPTPLPRRGPTGIWPPARAPPFPTPPLGSPAVKPRVTSLAAGAALAVLLCRAPAGPPAGTRPAFPRFRVQEIETG